MRKCLLHKQEFLSLWFTFSTRVQIELGQSWKALASSQHDFYHRKGALLWFWFLLFYWFYIASIPPTEWELGPCLFHPEQTPSWRCPVSVIEPQLTALSHHNSVLTVATFTQYDLTLRPLLIKLDGDTGSKLWWLEPYPWELRIEGERGVTLWDQNRNTRL